MTTCSGRQQSGVIARLLGYISAGRRAKWPTQCMLTLYVGKYCTAKFFAKVTCEAGETALSTYRVCVSAPASSARPPLGSTSTTSKPRRFIWSAIPMQAARACACESCAAHRRRLVLAADFAASHKEVGGEDGREGGGLSRCGQAVLAKIRRPAVQRLRRCAHQADRQQCEAQSTMRRHACCVVSCKPCCAICRRISSNSFECSRAGGLPNSQ